MAKTLFSDVPHFDLISNLKKEWSIWSKCLGKIIVINGVSSSGKTTIVKLLSKFGFTAITCDDTIENILLESLNSRNHILFLDSKKMLPHNNILEIMFNTMLGKSNDEGNYDVNQLSIVKDLEKSFIEIIKKLQAIDITRLQYDKIYDNATKYILSGQNVVIDIVMESNSEIDDFVRCFNNTPMFLGLLYKPLIDNLQNCLSRNMLSDSSHNPKDFRDPSIIVTQYFNFYNFKSFDNVESQDQDVIVEKVQKGTIKSSELSNSVSEELNKFMKLSAKSDVVVMPNVRCDFIIKKSMEKYQVIKNQNILENLIDEMVGILGDVSVESCTCQDLI